MVCVPIYYYVVSTSYEYTGIDVQRTELDCNLITVDHQMCRLQYRCAIKYILVVSCRYMGGYIIYLYNIMYTRATPEREWVVILCYTGV